ncbi:uncharacterized protein LOC127832269 isoform X2 [Dreissena polymorpha]|uniref:uncharacterized protein LOC127832269 isoform X2 n=1 Tax=Dreissena polymorpha TaxID=45954 RepID=UPI00226471DF|nr:uncharacterized protein LOC127832269 isoform X2 [Dreissena polymorpha]
MCHVCHIYRHKNCINLVLITDKVKALRQEGQFHELSGMMETLHGLFTEKKYDFEESIQLLEKSHSKTCEEINALHKKITDHLDHLQEETIKELDTFQATFKSSFHEDITHCSESVQTIKIAKEDWQKMQGKSEILHFVTYIKCLDHTNKADSILQEKVVEKDITFTFQPDTTIDQRLSNMMGLGKILSDVKQPTRRNITTDEQPTQAEPNEENTSLTSSKQPDKAHTISNMNNTDQMLHILSSSSKNSDFKANLTSDVNDSDQVLHILSSSSKKPGKANLTSDVNDSDQVLHILSSSSKQPDKANLTSDVNDSDQVLHILSSSSKNSDFKTNLTSDVNDSDEVLHPENILSEKPSAGNQSSDVKKSSPVSSSYRLPDHRNEVINVNKPEQLFIPKAVFRMIAKTKYSVMVKSDRETCTISGISETDAGELVIIDNFNNKAKLLDKTFKVVAHCYLPGSPLSMCSINSIASSLVAVALESKTVHFIRVTNRLLKRLVNERTLELKHACQGIAHHLGSLYITSGTALYHYTVDGTQMMKMYENTSEQRSVTSCAVSPSGDRIFVTNEVNNQLVTLSRDGKVLSTLTDPALNWRGQLDLPGLHVTNSGKVLVCAGYNSAIIKLDTDGRLTEVVTDCLDKPMSVYYSKISSTLIVGMCYCDNIIVMKDYLQL